ncbi:dynamin family protein [Couchioplanes azureus]|uniref:dynamin family protein n=1 Tax=Couchioplanes caeruleus TaxID=56438 RepID=UPI001670A3EE|nr:dynamin family protein [Couchioplanes caeruleus]GGQ48179.1 hypothetical protein GCM10010166_15410 [Couchioplanes caeruleus subsp. azureus]
MTNGVRVPPAAHGLGEHLDLAHRLIDLFPPGDERRDVWRGRIAQVHDRLADPRLRLAVIGEFSSGKTTFVNALLGEELFPASAVPTTTAAVRISYGPRPVVRARFRDGTQWSSNPADVADGAIRETLRRLTTGDDLASRVTAVELDHGAPVLRQGLVIVDTPGTNDDAGHSETARRAVLDADAAVVVLNARTLVPASLSSFLVGALDPHLLGRCVFVVTRMDEVDAEDHDRVRADAVQRVRTALGVAEPAVAFGAPGAVVRLRRGVPLSAAQAEWAPQFDALADWLAVTVGERRPAAVADTALRLLDDLLSGLDDGLTEDRAQARRQESALDAAQIADLDDFLRRHHKAASRALREAASAARAASHKVHAAALSRTRAEVRSAIAGCPNTSALEDALRGTVPQLVRTQLDALAGRIAGEARPIFADGLRTATGVVQTAFDREYHRLERAGRPRAAAPPVTRISPDQLVLTETFGAAVAVATADRSRDKMAFGWGAASGAAIGTMIVPGVGTVIGGFLGLVAGAVFSRDLAEVRAEATTSAVTTTEAVFAQAATQLDAAVAKTAHRAELALRDHLGWYRDSYRQTVDRIRSDQHRRREELRRRAEQLERARTETATHRARLEAERVRLATGGPAPSAPGRHRPTTIPSEPRRAMTS